MNKATNELSQQLFCGQLARIQKKYEKNIEKITGVFWTQIIHSLNTESSQSAIYFLPKIFHIISEGGYGKRKIMREKMSQVIMKKAA